MKRLVLSCVFLLPVALGAHRAAADIVHLTDGTQVEGTLKRVGDGWVVTTASGAKINIAAEQVESIEVSRAGAPSPAAGNDRLQSLRGVVGNMSDIRQIIDRYEKFIQQNKDTPVADEAAKDLQTWHDRLDQGLIKVGDKWMTPADRELAQHASQGEALAARDLMRQGRYKDADPILVKALSDDPENATAYYLRGVLLFMQEQIVPARKSFEAVDGFCPNHAPTLNNLAVIAWRQKSYARAMALYDQAMLATPLAKEIIDNVAEAVNALPADSRDTAVVKKALLDFQDQEAQLEKIENQQGLYRWGSSWVTTKELDDYKAQQQKVQDQVDQLQKDYDAVQVQVGTIDANIDQNNRELRRLEAQSLATDPNGNLVQLPYPPVYFDIQRDNTRLVQQRQTLVSKEDEIRNQAKQVQKDAPSPQYTGLQKIIGIEAAPIRNFGGTTQPATQPGVAGGIVPTDTPPTTQLAIPLIPIGPPPP
jgi:Flp pilus assembly protein TadD